MTTLQTLDARIAELTRDWNGAYGAIEATTGADQKAHAKSFYRIGAKRTKLRTVRKRLVNRALRQAVALATPAYQGLDRRFTRLNKPAKVRTWQIFRLLDGTATVVALARIDISGKLAVEGETDVCDAIVTGYARLTA